MHFWLICSNRLRLRGFPVGFFTLTVPYEPFVSTDNHIQIVLPSSYQCFGIDIVYKILHLQFLSNIHMHLLLKLSFISFCQRYPGWQWLFFKFIWLFSLLLLRLNEENYSCELEYISILSFSVKFNYWYRIVEWGK